MKKLVFVLFLTCISLNNLIAQPRQKYFLGNDYHLYKGVVLIYDKDHTLGIEFYYDRTLARRYTTSDSLFNRIFMVTDIIDSDKLKWSDDPLLVLEDTLTTQIIYYRYDTRFEFKWPFFSEKIEYDKELLCSYIVRRDDAFTGTTTFNTPLVHAGKRYYTILMKHIEGNSTNYYLSLHLQTETESGVGNNVILLFEDDLRINKQAEVKFDGTEKIGDSYWYKYKAMVPLNQNDLNTIISKEFKGFRLHVYDRFIHDNNQRELFKIFSDCVIQAK